MTSTNFVSNQSYKFSNTSNNNQFNLSSNGLQIVADNTTYGNTLLSPAGITNSITGQTAPFSNLSELPLLQTALYAVNQPPDQQSLAVNCKLYLENANPPTAPTKSITLDASTNSISTLTGNFNVNTDCSFNNHNISGVGNLTCNQLNYTTLNPPITITTPTLSQVLTAGNKASSTLDMSGNNITNANNITATKFIGDLSGNAVSATTATNALNVSTTATNSNTTYYIPMVSQYASSTNQTIYTDISGHLTINPFTNQLTTNGTIVSNGYTMNGSASQLLINNASASVPAISAPNALLVSFPSANVTATTFTGALSGTASSASAITTTSDNTSGTYYIPFSKTTAGTSTSLYLDDTTTPLTYNPSTSTLTASTFTGALSGTATNATNVNVTSDNTSGTYYIPFSKSSGTGNKALFQDDTTGPLSYNPSTSTLSATTFSGALSGNATSATTATNITTTSDNTSGTYYIPFSKTTAGTSTALYLDDTTGPLSYNPSTSTLTATTFSGTASSATNLSGGSVNAIPYQSSTGTTSYLSAGTTGQVLTTNGTGSAPTWTTISGGSQNLAQVLAVGNKAGTNIDMSGNQIVNCEGLTIIDTNGDSSPTASFNMLKYISSYITQIAPSTNGTQNLIIGSGVPTITNYWSSIQSYASSSITWAVGSASALLQLTSSAFNVNTSLQLTNTNSAFNLAKTETSYPAGATSSFSVNTTATASGTNPNSNQNILTLFDLPIGTAYNGILMEQYFTNGASGITTQNLIQSFGGGANSYFSGASSYDPYLFIQSQNISNTADSLLLLTPQAVIITSQNNTLGNFDILNTAGTNGISMSGGSSLNGGTITCGTINGSSGLNLQYNSSTKSSITTNGVQQTLLTTQGTATYSSSTLTLLTTASAPYPTFYQNIITITGTTNTISTITPPTNMPLGGMYLVYITNSGSGILTINATGLGTGIKTTYTSAVSVPASGLALGSLTKVGASTYIWSVNLVA